jgi:hypothetical protein
LADFLAPEGVATPANTSPGSAGNGRNACKCIPDSGGSGRKALQVVPEQPPNGLQALQGLLALRRNGLQALQGHPAQSNRSAAFQIWSFLLPRRRAYTLFGLLDLTHEA